MLVKRELSGIPVLSVPKAPSKKNADYLAAAQIAELPQSGKILNVDYFREGKLFSRFFTNGENYIVYHAKGEKWGNGYPIPCNGGGCSYWCHDSIYCTNESDSLIREFLPREHWNGSNKTGEVMRFIYDKHCEKRDVAINNKVNLMHKHMALFPGFPPNLKEYCENKVFKRGYIFISKKGKKGNRDAWCSHCGKHFTVHGDTFSGHATVCPECGHPAVYRGTWIKTDIVDSEKICICYKVNGELLIRWSNVERSFLAKDYQMRMHIGDFAYSLYTVYKGQQRIYTYKLFRGMYEAYESWHRLPIDSFCDSSSYVYTDNLNEVFGEKVYNVNLKSGLENQRCPIRFVVLLNNLKSNKKAEYLFKLGLPILAEHSGYIEGEPAAQGVFHQQLGISKQYLPLLRDMQVNFLELNMIKKSKDWITKEMISEYRRLELDHSDNFWEMISDIGFKRALSYVQKQYALNPKVKPRRLVLDYMDYIRMSKEMHVYLGHKSVLFPANVVEAHRTITARFNEHQNEIMLEKNKAENEVFSRKAAEQYARYGISEYSRGDYCVRLPRLRTDLIIEGQSLNHCVGGQHYADNHKSGERMIFFIRKNENPDKPFFTMELCMSDYSIKQLYGFGDCSAPAEVREFARDFVKSISKKAERRTA